MEYQTGQHTLPPNCHCAASILKLRSMAILLALWPLAFLALAETDPGQRAFHVPAGSADSALKLFCQQSGIELIYPTEITRGVQTKSVDGQMSVDEALVAMLSGTPLRAVINLKTGARAIIRRPISAADSQTAPKKKII